MHIGEDYMEKDSPHLLDIQLKKKMRTAIFISNGSSATLFECLYICLKLINRKKDRTKYISAFQKLINKFNDDIELIKIGFPTNWVKILSNK